MCARTLTHLSEVMEPAIEQVSERVFNTVGFDVANSTFVIGQDGIVVIDAMLSSENMANALLAFGSVSRYPVKGLVYSHSHGDHWGGSPTLVPPEQAASGEVPIIAQHMLMAEIAGINGFNQAIVGATGLPVRTVPATIGGGPGQRGGRTVPGPDPACGVGPPQHAGGRPAGDRDRRGEDGDRVGARPRRPMECVVWMPDLGVLQTAECVQGECYQNLYTLRGDVPRPAGQWVASMDVLRRFPAEALAKSHGRSVVGAEAAGTICATTGM